MSVRLNGTAVGEAVGRAVGRTASVLFFFLSLFFVLRIFVSILLNNLLLTRETPPRWERGRVPRFNGYLGVLTTMMAVVPSCVDALNAMCLFDSMMRCVCLMPSFLAPGIFRLPR